MQESLTVTINGHEKYEFIAYPAGSTLPTIPGVYLLLSRSGMNWSVLYVGEAQNLDMRSGSQLMQHEKHAAAARRGLTHVAIVGFAPTFAHERMHLERKLCQAFAPPLNKLLVG